MESSNGSREVIAFRFVVLCWIAGALILAFAGYEHIQARNAQAFVVNFSEGVVRCHQQEMDATPACRSNAQGAARACEAATHHCFDPTEMGYAQGERDATLERDQHSNRPLDAELLAAAMMIGAGALFYGARWAMTGRLRPLWLLRAPRKE
jgi:hypothetical protein